MSEELVLRFQDEVYNRFSTFFTQPENRKQKLLWLPKRGEKFSAIIDATCEDILLTRDREGHPVVKYTHTMSRMVQIPREKAILELEEFEAELRAEAQAQADANGQLFPDEAL